LKAVKILIIAAGVGTIGIVVFIHSGLFNIAADEPHWPVTREILSVVRDRSIQAHSAAVRPPDLDNDTSIRLGAGNYDSMCTACHRAPGMEESELSVGLYPKPPTWRKIGRIDPSEAFWVIKHGIKMTGMPAWGKSMSDKDIWNIVAFMRELPQLKPAAYRELVESSNGHLHDSGEDVPHSHGGMEIPG
jgi:cytochrome c5